MQQYFSKRKHVSGFTLVEFLIYFGLLGIFLSAITFTIFNTHENKVRVDNVIEINEQSRLINQTISYYVRSAELINYPTLGNNGDHLSLRMSDANIDPVEFDVSNGVFRIEKNNDGTVNLTSDRVTVSDLTFYNVTVGSGPGAIRVQYTLSINSESLNQSYDASSSFSTTVSLQPYNT